MKRLPNNKNKTTSIDYLLISIAITQSAPQGFNKYNKSI